MSIYYLMNLIKFNEDLERFYNIWGDCMDSEDITDLSGELWRIGQYTALKSLNCADSVGSAFEYLDNLTQSELYKAKTTANLHPITVKLAEILSTCLYSIKMDWFEDWVYFEDLYINCLGNCDLKNYVRISCENSDKENLRAVRNRIAAELRRRLYTDIKDSKIGIVEKCRIMQEFRDNYEPDITDCELLDHNNEWRILETAVKSATYGELFESLADWLNTMVFVDWDTNGNEIYGDYSGEDLIFLIGGLLIWC